MRESRFLSRNRTKTALEELVVNHLLVFVGRFHPLLVHLPIGALVLLGLLELISGLTRWKNVVPNRHWILAFAAMGACAAAGCGWLLAETGGYDSQLLKAHRFLGIALSAACLGTFLTRRRVFAYRVSLAGTLLLLAIASHLGGSLTHGRDFLTRYAPKPFRGLQGSAGIPRPGLPVPEPVFTTMIQPILQERCSACHGPEKHKADLRLDTLEGLRQGGRSGPLLNAGKESLLIQRITLPVDDDGHMPPEGNVQPTSEEITLLQWWIHAGTPSAVSINDLKLRPEIRHLLEVVFKRSELAK